MKYVLYPPLGKMIPLIIAFSIVIATNSAVAQGKTLRGDKVYAKLFLYGSDLPLALTNRYYELRKHVVDVVLATQKYDIVFSEIPDYLALCETPQFILKYRLRTSGPSQYSLEFFLIDADRVTIVKDIKYEKIHSDELLYLFRLSLYEFILNRTLRPLEEAKFNKESQDKIKTFAKENKAEKTHTPTPTASTEKNEIKNNTQLPKNINEKQISKTGPTKKPSLWELLKDLSKDIPWDNETKIAEDKNSDKLLQQIEETKLNENPFLMWANISLKGADELSSPLTAHQFHTAWKYVQRELSIKDLAKVRSQFVSVLSFTAEWIYYFPLHISRLMFRTGMELDRAVSTSPIKMDQHFLFRTGVGYRTNNWFMPSLYYEQSSLNYANLNEYGGGIVANTHEIRWISLETAILGNQTYFSTHLAKSIASTKNGDPREVSGPSGYRYGVNLRYFFNNKIFKMRLWGDLEYRRESFTRDNIDNKMEIEKSEYSSRIGIHF